MSNRCSICRLRSTRDVVNSALLAGVTPAEVLRRYGEELRLSGSAIYRHARSHRAANALSVTWVGADTTSGEVVSDLAELRRNLFEQYRAQVERGADAAATRSAHEAHAVSATLLKAGVDSDEDVAGIRYSERILRAIQRAARNRPEFALEIAVAGHDLKDNEIAEDAESLLAAAIEFNNDHTK